MSMILGGDEDPESYGEQMSRRRVEAAGALAADRLLEVKKLQAELDKVKRDFGWTMKHLRIADIIFHGEEKPGERNCGALAADPQDSERLSFINQHGRVALGQGSITIAMDFPGGDGEVPTPFNIRHIIDICRFPNGRTEPVAESKPESTQPPAQPKEKSTKLNQQNELL